MQSELTKLKVHNEMALCETTDMEMKQKIEHVLLENRISYYIKWYRQGLFKRNREVCVFCVNENAKDQAEELVQALAKDSEAKVKFLLRRLDERYF